jgi:hypothetical protein
VNIASARFGVTDPAERTAAAEIVASTMVRIGSSSLFMLEANALHFIELNASTNPECLPEESNSNARIVW